MNDELTIDPAAQYQCGDIVIYIPEGIVAQVIGFKWSKGMVPRITGYHLGCGVCVAGNHLKRYTNELDSRRRKEQSQ